MLWQRPKVHKLQARKFGEAPAGRVLLGLISTRKLRGLGTARAKVLEASISTRSLPQTASHPETWYDKSPQNASSKVSSCYWYIYWFRGPIQPSDASCPQTSVYVLVTYWDTQDHTPTNLSLTEWDVCWPMATWYMSWHMAICLSVVSLPSKLFELGCGLFLHS